jgi:hypothetical protein
MKKHFIFTAILSLFLLAISVSAQKGPSFSGTWTLDIAKSKLSDREKAAIESQVLTAVQTDKDIKITTVTKRIAPAGAAAPQGGGGGGRGGMGAGETTSTFTLDGKEVVVDSPGPNGATIPTRTMSKWDGSKLVLTSSRTFNTPNGEVTSTAKETWELSADGKTLTITRETTNPQGTSSTTRVHTKS